jgi:hypothetical protein
MWSFNGEFGSLEPGEVRQIGMAWWHCIVWFGWCEYQYPFLCALSSLNDTLSLRIVLCLSLGLGAILEPELICSPPKPSADVHPPHISSPASATRPSRPQLSREAPDIS